MLKHKTIQLAFATLATSIALSILSTGCMQPPGSYRRGGGDLSGGVTLPGPYAGDGSGPAYNSAGIRPEDSDPNQLPVTPLPPPEAEGTQPLLKYTFEKLGYSAHEITVSTRTVLKVRFTPGKQKRAAKGYPDTFPEYGKLMVYVKVGSRDLPTPALSNGLDSAKETSSELNFSNSFTRTCASDDTSCRQNVKIVIHRPNYDYYCRSFPAHPECYLTPGWGKVAAIHYWNGMLEVRTDDTVAFD